MRASTIFVALATLAATAMADYPTPPITTGVSIPSGMPTPPSNTTNGTHTPSPHDDTGAGAALSPAGFLGLAVAGVAIVVGGVAL